ncbi:MAG: hypothetical protein ACLFP4_07290 [Spirochaetales bacterium]
MGRHREGHRSRVFYSYLLSFFLILLVPVVISFSVFHRAQSIVSEEVERANNALQTQVSKYLDLVMENSQQLNHLVVYNI